jgi:hypothetical protein
MSILVKEELISQPMVCDCSIYYVSVLSLLTKHVAGFVQDIAAEEAWVSNEKELNYPRGFDLYEQNTAGMCLVFLYYLRHICGLPYAIIKYVTCKAQVHGLHIIENHYVTAGQ